MSNKIKRLDPIEGEEVEFCNECGKQLMPGSPRYRTDEGTFCPECYKKRTSTLQ